MQIVYRELLEWIAWIAVVASGAFMALGAYIWKGDRERLKSLEISYSSLEVRMAHAVTKPEAEHLFEKAKESYHAEHGQILEQLAALRADQSDLIGELISILRQPWRGEERRRK